MNDQFFLSKSAVKAVIVTPDIIPTAKIFVLLQKLSLNYGLKGYSSYYLSSTDGRWLIFRMVFDSSGLNVDELLFFFKNLFTGMSKYLAVK
jgi:hypothetical protein